MSYYDRLTPWCIIRCLPGAQTLIIQRFRKRTEAEEHLKILRRLSPDAVYEIVFDLPEERSEVGEMGDRLCRSP